MSIFLGNTSTDNHILSNQGPYVLACLPNNIIFLLAAFSIVIGILLHFVSEKIFYSLSSKHKVECQLISRAHY